MSKLHVTKLIVEFGLGYAHNSPWSCVVPKQKNEGEAVNVDLSNRLGMSDMAALITQL